MVFGIVVVGASNPDILRLLGNSTLTASLMPTGVGFVDRRFGEEFQTYFGFPILGPVSVLESEDFESSAIINTVASTTQERKKVSDYLYSIGRQARTLVPHYFNFTDVKIGRGVLVYLNTYIGAGVEIGSNSLISDSSRVGHETKIGSDAFVGPGAVICGRVKVGDLAYVGSGATILPDLSVGSSAVVGAGSVVTKDVPEGVTVVGNPARILRS